MAYLDLMNEKFPIRKSKIQKEAFRAWVMEEAARLGYDQAEVSKKGSSNNVVIGKPEEAQAIFTAHYDTPPVMPVPNFITPCNVGVYLVYQIGIVLALVLICVGAGALANLLAGSDKVGYVLGYVMYMVALVWMMFGPANKHNANDNTSGVAAVLETMALLTPEERSKAAFILFDNEEKGLLGSGAFASKHKKLKKEAVLVNMDCVGLGETILFFARKKTRALPKYDLLVEAVGAQEGRKVEWKKLEKCRYPSDQNNFTHGIAVNSCKHSKLVGYYCDKIHTKHDTYADQGNIDFIARGLKAFVEKL